MESYRSTTDPCAGNGGGFQTQDMQQQGSVHYSTPSLSSVQSFSGQMQEVVRAGPIQVPPARAGSPSVHHVDAARRRFVVRPAAESLHAAAMHTGQTAFCTQVGGGYGMPFPHMFPGARGYGIAPHVYPAQHTVERGGVMRDEWQWSPQCRQPSQPMHGGLSATSPMSVLLSAAEASPSLAEVQQEDMDEGWPVHSRAPSLAGLQGPSFGGEEDDFVGDDEVEGDGGDVDGRNSDNAQEERDSATVGQRHGGENEAGPQTSKRANKRGGKDAAAKSKKQNIPWSLDERIALSRIMAKHDALMADADRQHRFKRSKDRYEWVHNRMVELGFPHRSTEDCRKKWQGMMAAAKLILDKCENASGKPSYWDMTLEERKAEQVPLGFEKALWEAMEWKLNRPSIKCDNTLASENLPANAGGKSLTGGPAQPSSGRSTSDGKETEDSDHAAKTRRTNTGKARMDDTISGGTTLGSAIAVKIGDMADAMRGGNIVLEMLVGIGEKRSRRGEEIGQGRRDREGEKRSRRGEEIGQGRRDREGEKRSDRGEEIGQGRRDREGEKRSDRGEEIAKETRLERGTERHRNMDWGPSVMNELMRIYYALVNGLLAMRIVAGLGYERDGSLSEVFLFVKELSNVVPDSWLGPRLDVVGDIVRYLVSAIAEEHAETSSNSACYVAHMEPPLRERGYLHGAV
ncbi:hypothetical protein CBR_g8184 [Chara braunii]|uniref:Myb-like domain-containing protein n=1 Tax=Chara braunii TaxID=69332 RepID=A0A388KLF3_CHABU|nr:hypothetical protein CBR_g8184 [Chara braunii]|eukprot:GBG70884.1 hypothetical protein CBR_g8184 [Chara braunii]